MDAEEAMRAMQADAISQGDFTGWFETLYEAAGAGDADVPWDRGTPNELLMQWVERERPAVGTRTVVVGSGYGRDSEYLVSLGLDVLGFDVAPSAIDGTRLRFPDSPASYEVGDLFALRPEWRQAFDLVVESMNVQALPPDLRAGAIAGVADLVAPGGRAVVICLGHDGPAAVRDELDAREAPPYRLLRSEIESFTDHGLVADSIERIIVPRDPDEPRWRATFSRPHV